MVDSPYRSKKIISVQDEILNEIKYLVKQVLNILRPQKGLKNSQKQLQGKTDNFMSWSKKEIERHINYSQQLQRRLKEQRAEWRSRQLNLHKLHQEQILQINIINQTDRKKILAEKTDLQSKLKSLDSEIKRTKEELNNQKDNAEFFRLQVSKSQEQVKINNQLKEQSTILNQANYLLQNEMRSHKQILRNTESEMTQLKQELNVVKDQKKKRDREVEQFANTNETLKKELQRMCRMEKFQPSETQFKESIKLLQSTLSQAKLQTDRLIQTLSEVKSELKDVKKQKEKRGREVEQFTNMNATLKKELQRICKMEKFQPSETQFKELIKLLQSTLRQGKQQTQRLNQTFSDLNLQLNAFKGFKFQREGSVTQKIASVLKQLQCLQKLEGNLGEITRGLGILSEKEKDQTKQGQQLMKLGELYPIQCAQYHLVSCIYAFWCSAVDRKTMQIAKCEDLLTECSELLGTLNKDEKERDKVLTRKTSKGVENARLQTIRTQVAKVSKTLKENSQNLSQQRYSNDNLRRANRQLEEKKKNMEIQNHSNQTQMAKLKKDLSDKHVSHFQLEKQLQTESAKTRDLNTNLQKLLNDIEKKSEELKAQLTKAKRLQSEIQRLKSDLFQSKNSQLKSEKVTAQSLNQQIGRLNENAKKLGKQNSDLKEQVTKVTSEAERFRGERDSLKDEKDKLSKQVSEYKVNTKSLNDKLKIKEAQLDSHKSQISVLLTDKRNLEARINELNIDCQKLNSKYDETDKKLSQEKRQRKIQVDEMCETVNRQLSDLTKTDHKLRGQDFKHELPKLFDMIRLKMSRRLCPKSLILDNEDNDKIEFLSQALEKGRGRIKFCQLLYKFDTISKVNFHAYIDNKKNVLLIVKLVNGLVLGGFTGEAPNQLHTPGSGFLYSLTNKFVLDVTNINSKMAKVITPDDLSITFGNSELRMRTADDMIFSNLGLLQAYFNDKEKGIKVHDLLGEGVGVKNAKMDTYEFHQITFGDLSDK